MTYRPTGSGHRARTAKVDLIRIPDPEAWLTNRLGTLASFEIRVSEGASADAVNPSDGKGLDAHAFRKIGLELRDGHDVGRDPCRMTADELAALGHTRMSPLRALRLRCIDCSGDSAAEVRLCTAVTCPAWPFRMGANPWRAPASEPRRENGRRIAARMPRGAKKSFSEKEQIELQDVAATLLPAHPDEDKKATFSHSETEGRS